MNVNPVLNIAAQIIGFCGTYMLITLYQQNDHRKLLIKKLFADILWFIHYILLGAWAGSIPNFVGILRESLFIANINKLGFSYTFMGFCTERFANLCINSGYNFTLGKKSCSDSYFINPGVYHFYYI